MRHLNLNNFDVLPPPNRKKPKCRQCGSFKHMKFMFIKMCGIAIPPRVYDYELEYWLCQNKKCEAKLLFELKEGRKFHRHNTTIFLDDKGTIAVRKQK